MKDYLNNLKRAAQENPVAALAVAALAVTATAKLITAVGSYQGSHAYAQDVARRVKASKH
jgi:hypothetical protein